MKKYRLSRYFFVLVFFVVAFIIIYDLVRLVITNQKLEMMLLTVCTKQNQKQQKEKTTKEDVKEELLKSIKESDGEFDSNLDEIGQNMIKLENAITAITGYEEVIKI